MADDEEIIIQDAHGSNRGHFLVRNADPLFLMSLTTEPWKVPIDQGDFLMRYNTGGSIERRPVIAVGIAGSPFLGYELEIMAPRAISTPNPDASYIKHFTLEGGLIELRPGAVIIGGRDTGFYDGYGTILEAHHTGGSLERFEDWAFRVLIRDPIGGDLAAVWILLSGVGLAVAAPTSITQFTIEEDTAIDDLLATGERELFEYFLAHPEALDRLSPKRLEQLVLAIYRNLGFDTEPIGAWNQADGGVDIVAVSKTAAGTDLRLAIQCRTSKRKVSARPIRELAGVLDTFGAHQGIVATTSRFTKSARREAEGHYWRIALQDRDELFRRVAAVLIGKMGI